MKTWIGNKSSIKKTLGKTNCSRRNFKNHIKYITSIIYRFTKLVPAQRDSDTNKRWLRDPEYSNRLFTSLISTAKPHPLFIEPIGKRQAGNVHFQEKRPMCWQISRDKKRKGWDLSRCMYASFTRVSLLTYA